MFVDRKYFGLRNVDLFSQIVVFECIIGKFVAHAIEIADRYHVSTVFRALLQDNRDLTKATHNIMACRILQDGQVHEERNDDGESGAGTKILQVLRSTNSLNLVVVVTRWYGGSHLGNSRFKAICNVTRLAIEAPYSQ